MRYVTKVFLILQELVDGTDGGQMIAHTSVMGNGDEHLETQED